MVVVVVAVVADVAVVVVVVVAFVACSGGFEWSFDRTAKLRFRSLLDSAACPLRPCPLLRLLNSNGVDDDADLDRRQVRDDDDDCEPHLQRPAFAAFDDDALSRP